MQKQIIFHFFTSIQIPTEIIIATITNVSLYSDLCLFQCQLPSNNPKTAHERYLVQPLQPTVLNILIAHLNAVYLGIFGTSSYVLYISINKFASSK